MTKHHDEVRDMQRFALLQNILLFGTIASLGLKTLIEAQVNLMRPKNLVIVSSVLTVGIGGMLIKLGTMAFSGVGLCALLAIVLNAILPDRE